MLLVLRRYVEARVARLRKPARVLVSFATLDTATGDDTTIGSSVPISGHVWTGATGTAGGTLYASSTDQTTSTLYTVDTATGAATVLGEITDGPCVIDIAINASGEMYGLDICLDVLLQIDPASGAGTAIGPIGFEADFAQGMDFEDRSGALYLAAYNTTDSQGELRIADTSTGNSVLVGRFANGAETDALAFAEPKAAPVQIVRNPSFESYWEYWGTDGYPLMSGTSYDRERSVMFYGEEVWIWQEVFIRGDATEVDLSYWITGISSDVDWDNDILCGGLWDLTLQTNYVDACFGLTHFYHDPMVWKERSHALNADELASVAGKWVLLGFRQEQNWGSDYSMTSTAYVDEIALNVTVPLYDYRVFQPLITRQ